MPVEQDMEWICSHLWRSGVSVRYGPPTIGKARDMGLDRHCQFSVFTSASHLSLYKLLCCLFPYWPFQCFHCRSVHERLALILLVTALCCIASHNPEFSPYHLLYSLKDAEVSHLKPSHYNSFWKLTVKGFKQDFEIGECKLTGKSDHIYSFHACTYGMQLWTVMTCRSLMEQLTLAMGPGFLQWLSIHVIGDTTSVTLGTLCEPA